VSWPVVLLALLEIPLVAWGTHAFARRGRAGQYIRPEGPQAHAAKAGTPTMAGIIPLSLLTLGLLVTWLGGGPFSPGAGFALTAAWLAGAIGLLDDLLSQCRRASLGLTPVQKLLLGGVAAAALFSLVPLMSPIELRVPFSSLTIPLAALPAWATFLLILLPFWGTTNAVNLTDGLDGLAPGAVLLALVALVPLLWGKDDLVSFALVSAGAVAGFLWINAYPAGAFLGDVGSMGLGGLLFGLTFAGGVIFVLPILGGLFVIEALSVILQVLSYKLTGRRLLKMSPLHHHLEEGEVAWPHWLPGTSWPEPKAVVRLWLASGWLALLGVLAGIR